jgi:hypothetical protein
MLGASNHPYFTIRRKSAHVLCSMEGVPQSWLFIALLPLPDNQVALRDCVHYISTADNTYQLTLTHDWNALDFALGE